MASVEINHVKGDKKGQNRSLTICNIHNPNTNPRKNAARVQFTFSLITIFNLKQLRQQLLMHVIWPCSFSARGISPLNHPTVALQSAASGVNSKHLRPPTIVMHNKTIKHPLTRIIRKLHLPSRLSAFLFFANIGIHLKDPR